MQNPKNKLNVVLTGGHAGTTASALIEEIKSQKLNWELFWIGSEFAMEGSKVETLEKKVLPKLGVTFLPLTSGRLQRKFTIWTIPSLIKIPVGFLQAFNYLIKVRPSAVVSFGGYSSLPVVFAAWALRIPSVIHEQTTVAGRANEMAAPFASKIALAREGSLKYFPKNKTEVVGNPVSKSFLEIANKSKVSEPPILFITGGSRGSSTINKTVETLLRKLLQEFNIVHQVGEGEYDYYIKVRNELPEKLKSNYKVYGSISRDLMPKIMEGADIIISRAGANTVSEIIGSARPAIFIPIPFSYRDEQTANAAYAQKFINAEIIKQDEFNATSLLTALDRLTAKGSSLLNKTKRTNPDYQASKKLLELVKNLINES